MGLLGVMPGKGRRPALSGELIVSTVEGRGGENGEDMGEVLTD